MIDKSLSEEGKFKYIETGGDGVPLVLLHGLMGALSNFEGIINEFSKTHNVVVPMLPLFEISFRKISVTTLLEYIEEFIDHKGYSKVHILGNSLGGHLAQLYALKRPEKTDSLILTGSSGLFESAMGTTFPKRGNKDYIRHKTEAVFYNKDVATQELIDEVYDTVNDLKKAMCVVATAKSAVRHNLEDKLHLIKMPTLLVWGVQDSVTPIWVGEKFHELIANSELVKVDECGHAPMMEKPVVFNVALRDFIFRVENDTFFSSKKDVIVVK